MRRSLIQIFCPWPWIKPAAKTVRISAWFIHQAAPVGVLLTPDALLSLNSLWAIPGMSPKVRTVIQCFPTRGSLPTCAFHDKKKKPHKWIFPWVMQASSTATDSGTDDWSDFLVLQCFITLHRSSTWELSGIFTVWYWWVVSSSTGPAGSLPKGTLSSVAEEGGETTETFYNFAHKNILLP